MNRCASSTFMLKFLSQLLEFYVELPPLHGAISVSSSHVHLDG